MSDRNDELKRLQRIRAQQISARDPLAKERAYHQRMAKRPKSKLTLGSMLKDFQLKWLWMFAGGIIGLVGALILNSVLKTYWAPVAGFALVAAGLIVGRLMGAVVDWRSDDWTKHR